MKKNKTMRLASVLLIAVLLTTSIISGTFAKYVTTGETSDEARVARFGVVVTGSGDLFSTTYKKVSNGNGPSTATEDEKPFTALTVESSNTDNLVAPGTKNDTGLKLAVTGKPEVDVKITLSIDSFQDIFLKSKVAYPDMTTSSNLDDKFTFYSEDGKTDYHPVLFTLTTGDGEAVFENLTLEDLQTALESYEVYVDANTDLSAKKYSYKLSWKWEFEGPYSYNYDEGATGILMNKKKVDQADTLLGDLVAAKKFSEPVKGLLGVEEGTYSLDINVAISLTVTQVD